MLDFTLPTLLLAAGAFFAGGMIKGALGVGLPLIAVPLLATAIDLPTAVALMIVPITSSNLVQSLQGGHVGPAVRRYWLILIPLVLGALISAQFLAEIDFRTGALFLGAIVIAFAAVQALPLQISIAPERVRFLNPLMGAIGGLIGGVSNLFGLPLIMYLIALRLPKDEFVATVALFFLTGSVTLYAVLFFNGLLSLEIVGLSAAGAIPMGAGLFIGGRLRSRIEQKTFERLLLVVLFLIGINLVRRGLM
jgi:uncharacterized membrane protein YfcA